MKKLILSALTLVLFFGCDAKKRDKMIAEGQGGPELMSISEPNKEFALKVTGDHEAAVKSEGKQSLVNYETEATLIGKIPMKAKKDASYSITYTLNEDNTLTVSKVSTPEGFEKDESSSKSARNLDDGKVSLKLMTYQVKYFKLGAKKNADGEETKQLIEVETDKATATHFKADKTTVIAEETVTKLTSLSKAYLGGTWDSKLEKLNAKGEADAQSGTEEKVHNFKFEIGADNMKAVTSGDNGAKANTGAGNEVQLTVDAGAGGNAPAEGAAAKLTADVATTETKPTAEAAEAKAQESDLSLKVSADGTEGVILDLSSIKHSGLPNTFNIVNFEIDSSSIKIIIQDKSSSDRYRLLLSKTARE